MAEFSDRIDAGRQLARLLQSYASDDVVLLGLPRGGVLVAAEAARVLGLPTDMIVVRKVGLPGQPELAMGAVGEGGVMVQNADVMRYGRVTRSEFEDAAAIERQELERRVRAWRREGQAMDLSGCSAVLVDDGVATGATVRAACAVVRQLGADRVVVATPVAPPEMTAQDLGADELVVVVAPVGFRAVGMHYADFSQTTDAEVAEIIGRSGRGL